MPGLVAEMRHVDNRGRVVCYQANFGAALKRRHTLAQAENWKGAQKAKCVDFVIHIFAILGMFQPVHRDVTARPRDAAWYVG